MKMPDNFLRAEVRDGESISVRTKKLFKVSIEILGFIDHVCEKHGLRYFAACGTLLGAMRHKGFVPWDDDIDLWMPRKDYDKFQEVVVAELPEYYFVQTCVTDPTSVHDLIRIRDSRTTATQKWQIDLKLKTHMGIWVTIFPLEGRSRDHLAAESILARKWLLASLWRIAYWSGSSSIKRRIFGVVMKSLIRVIGPRRLYQMRQRIGNVFAFPDSELCCIGTGDYVLASFKPDWFRESLTVPFEYSTIKVPLEYDKILTKLYGDWRTPVRGAAEHEILDLEPDVPYKDFVEKKYGYRP